jgi:hypothetical protein
MTSGRPLSSHLCLSIGADSRRLRARPHAVLGALFLTVLVTVCILSFVGTGGAAVIDGQYAHGDGSDNTPPSVADGRKINATAVEVTIADNHDVDESTIEQGDFLLSDGSVEGFSVTENGSNATVTLLLDRRLDKDELTVVIQSGATILDTNENVLDSSASDSFAVIDGMDSVPPSLSEFSVTNATGSPATIRIAAREPLGDFHMAIGGPTTDALDISDFEQVDGQRVWETEYSPEADATYGVYLQNYTDEHGNTLESGRNKRFLSDLTPPTAVATLDLANSQNLSIAFDARRSADASGIDSYEWSFGDGENATGPRVSNEYRPGNYTAELTVTDIYGNAATDSVTLNLSTGSGNVSDTDGSDINDSDINNSTLNNSTLNDSNVNNSAINDSDLQNQTENALTVSVERPGDGTTDDALVSVENARRNQPTAFGKLRDGTPLAVHGPVSLDGMSLTLATNRSFNLGISISGNGSVADAAAPGRIPVGGFTVVNTVADENISNATIDFSVAQPRMQSLGVPAGNVSLFRFHDGSWNAVPTRALNASNGTQSFRAQPPGFSRFAIAATRPTTPDFSVTGATLDTNEVAPGDTFTVTATVENSGAGDGTFVGGLEANGTVVATGTTQVAAGETATLSLQSTTDDAGTYALSVNGTSAGTLTVAAPQSDERPATDGETDSTNASEDDSTNASENGTMSQFVVTNASLGANSVDVDEPFAVNATIENRGDERGAYTAALEINGSVVTTKTRPIPAGDSLTIQLNYLINRSGEFPVSVNGTSAGTLTVGAVGDDSSSDGGGGLLSSLFGILAILPLGLLRPIVLFVVAPLVVIYGILKGLAIYLGY